MSEINPKNTRTLAQNMMSVRICILCRIRFENLPEHKDTRGKQVGTERKENTTPLKQGNCSEPKTYNDSDKCLKKPNQKCTIMKIISL